MVAAYVLALGEVVDFEALNCLPALNLPDAGTNVRLSAEPAFLPKVCYERYYPFSLSLLS